MLSRITSQNAQHIKPKGRWATTATAIGPAVKNRNLRLQWAQDDWTVQDWKGVAKVDES